IDGNRSFFRSDVPAAFSDVKDTALVAEFKKTNDAVIAALGDYKTFLEGTLLAQSTGSFAMGADTYAKKLSFDEMIDLPLDRLLAMAEVDRQKNSKEFAETAARIDARKSPLEVLELVERDRPSAGGLLKATQDTVASVRQFIVDHHVITIPTSEPVSVRETPPFMRSTATASTDTPGPVERVGNEAD